MTTGAAPPPQRLAAVVVWSLLLNANRSCGETVWSEWPGLEGSPPPRSKTATVLSQRVGFLDTEPKLLLFGGCDQAGARSDLWTIDLGFLPLSSVELESDPATAGQNELNPSDSPVWKEVPATGLWPPARCEHSLAALGDGTVLLFGGTGKEDGKDALNDLWTYSPSTARFDRIEQPANISTDTCDTDGQTWPYRRYGHGATAQSSVMWMFGGWISACGQNSVTDELWSFDMSTTQWTRYPPKSLRPSARTSHNVVASSSTSILIMGGWDGAVPRDDMWQFSPATALWSQLYTDNSPAEPGPSKRYGASLNSIAGGIILHGGTDRSQATEEFFSDLWVFTFPKDEEQTTRTSSESTASCEEGSSDCENSGTTTTTITTKIAPVNENKWVQVSDATYADAPERAYHGALVWGEPGFEHVVVFGGSKSTGEPMDYLGVITLNGEVPSKVLLYVAVAASIVAALVLLCTLWRLGKRYQRRKLIRRWQTAYLMVRAHLDTKKRQAEEAAELSDDDVRPASNAVQFGAVSSAKRVSTRRRRKVGSVHPMG